MSTINLPRLKDELDAIRRERGPEWERIYDVSNSWLRQRGLSSPGPRVGDRIPDFVLPSTRGRFWSTNDILASGPVVLSFNRGTWCPYCRAEMKAHDQIVRDLKAMGANLFAITADLNAKAMDARREMDLAYETLIDVDFGVTLAFGLLYQVPDELRRALEDRNLRLPDRYGNGAWFLPVTATFVVDRDRTIRFAFNDTDARHRAEPEDIVKALKALRVPIREASL